MKLSTPILLLLTATLLPAEVAGPGPAHCASLSAEHFDSYLAALKQRISINERNRDPFGLPQDLTTNPGESNPQPPEPPTPLAEIVKSIHITAIDPRAGEFLIGARILREGAVFALVSGTYRARLRVEEVSPGAIILRNIETGETVTLSLDINPLPKIDWQAPPLPHGVEPAGQAPIRLPDLRRT